jgi:hypothetical protein
MAPGQYDTPLADFLDALPGYVNQFQQNQLALERQELADKRYEDSQQIAKSQREEEQRRYDKLQEDKQSSRKRSDYDKIIAGISKFDLASKAIAARKYGYENEAQIFSEQAENQNSSLSELRSNISTIQNLGENATFYDFDKIASNISPEDISMLKERDEFAYDTLVKAKSRFDNQRRTGMRTMSDQDKFELQKSRRSIGEIERKMLEVALKMPNVDTDNKTSQQILKALRATGVDPSGQLSTLIDQLNIEKRTVQSINDKYRIVEPNQQIIAPQTGEGEDEIEDKVVFGPDASLMSRIPESPEDASNQGNTYDLMTIVSSAEVDSPEYKEAIEELAKGREIDITTPRPLRGFSLTGLIERLSESGLEREQLGDEAPVMFGIDPKAKAFKLPPTEGPERYDRSLLQFNNEIDKLNTLTLNPEQYEGFGRRGANQKLIELNSAYKTRDNLVNQIKDLYKEIPKTKQYESQIKKYKEIIDKYPTGIEVVLDRKARKGKGQFKVKKGKLSKSDKMIVEKSNESLKNEGILRFSFDGKPAIIDYNDFRRLPTGQIAYLVEFENGETTFVPESDLPKNIRVEEDAPDERLIIDILNNLTGGGGLRAQPTRVVN